MNLALFALLFVGVIFILVGYIRSQRHCPPAKIEYRFVPMTFEEQQNAPVPITDIFAQMFYETPFIANHESSKLLPPPTQQQRDMNRFFISQN